MNIRRFRGKCLDKGVPQYSRYRVFATLQADIKLKKQFLLLVVKIMSKASQINSSSANYSMFGCLESRQASLKFPSLRERGRRSSLLETMRNGESKLLHDSSQSCEKEVSNERRTALRQHGWPVVGKCGWLSARAGVCQLRANWPKFCYRLTVYPFLILCNAS